MSPHQIKPADCITIIQTLTKCVHIRGMVWVGLSVCFVSEAVMRLCCGDSGPSCWQMLYEVKVPLIRSESRPASFSLIKGQSARVTVCRVWTCCSVWCNRMQTVKVLENYIFILILITPPSRGKWMIQRAVWSDWWVCALLKIIYDLYLPLLTHFKYFGICLSNALRTLQDRRNLSLLDW